MTKIAFPKFRASLRDFLFWFSRSAGRPAVYPDVVQIPMTQACNLRCSMCALDASKNQELSKETIFNVIDQAADMGIPEAVLTGGEPLLRRDLLDICGHCRAKGIRSIVTTNGTLIDEQFARAAIASGMNHIHFSLDGMEKTNDLMRGKDNFKKAIEGICILEKLRKEHSRGLSIGIACTVMGPNLEDLMRLLLYADSLGVDAINFQPLLKNNFNTPDRGDSQFWVCEEKLPVLKKAIREIKSFRGKHIQVYEEPGLELLEKYYRGTLSDADWKCFGGYKTAFVCVGDNGDPLVYTCHGICGNLKEKSLRECWNSKEACALRKSVKKCGSPCLQSCYSRKRSESLAAIGREFLCRS